LFWLALIPFATSWLGQNYTKPWPTALYGIIALLIGFAYRLLWQAIYAVHRSDPQFVADPADSTKGILAVLLYALAIALAFVNHWFSDVIFVLVAIMYFIPASLSSRHSKN
jgi:uncharacterized membrane protein